ncbi:MAG: cation diffusion facilitator family transporter [Pseudomonadota bacterium]|uniref:cation diffusion facilitator family transporter n=1 Tax=Gallaecimonas pentaromativorans TaxID=584787 RepID=UPI00067E7284|nr:cation diffusion facilitator family transporter [Gallaecimonas pentaromativorans]MED5525483.1 cation diffusion facilitator family transporter [Pseudomonadota bacterium]
MSHSHHHHGHDDVGNIKVAFFLNLGFTLIEIVGGLLTNSVAILSDAVHDLGDSLALGLGWWLGNKAKAGPSARFSYGPKRLSLLAALINALVLVTGSVLVLSEAIPRLWDPQMPHAGGMIGLAILGIAVNGAAVFRLKGAKSQNAKVVSWHLLEDVLGWVMVLVVAVVMLFVKWPILDPLLSVFYTAFILYNVVKNLWGTVLLFMQATPADIDLAAVKRDILAIDNVSDVHHLHAWSFDGEQHVVTGHVVARQALDAGDYLALKSALAGLCQHYPLAHTTFEIEYGDEPCRLSEPHHAH